MVLRLRSLWAELVQFQWTKETNQGPQTENELNFINLIYLKVINMHVILLFA